MSQNEIAEIPSYDWAAHAQAMADQSPPKGMINSKSQVYLPKSSIKGRRPLTRSNTAPESRISSGPLLSRRSTTPASLQPSKVKGILKRSTSIEDEPLIDVTVSLKKNTRRNGRRRHSRKKHIINMQVMPPVDQALGSRRWQSHPDSLMKLAMNGPSTSPGPKPTQAKPKRKVSFQSLEKATRWEHQGSQSTNNLQSLMMPSQPSRRGSYEEQGLVKKSQIKTMLKDVMSAYDTIDWTDSSPKSTQATLPAGGLHNTMNSSEEAELRRLVNTVCIRKPSRRGSVVSNNAPTSAKSSSSPSMDPVALRQLLNRIHAGKEAKFSGPPVTSSQLSVSPTQA